MAVGLLPAIAAGGAVADTSAEQPTTAQPLVIDSIIDAFSDNDEADENTEGGILDSILGESFDGYPDGFSENGIEDFEQALGDDSVHYQADSLSWTTEATTPTGESAEITAQVNAETKQALISGTWPDGERDQYFDGDIAYVNEAGEYDQQSASFEREELYLITDFTTEFTDANLSQETIDGDTVIYTAEDVGVELAVRDTGELDYLEITEDEEVYIDFYDYDATTVEEPAWVAEAESVTDEPQAPTDDGERTIPESDTAGERVEVVEERDGERVRIVEEDGERVVEEIERGSGSAPDAATGSSPDEERLRERAEMLEERIEFIEEQIEQAEDGDDDRRDHDDRINELEERIDRHQDRIDRLEDQIEEIEVGDRETEFREEISALEDEREELREERNTLRERFEETDDEERQDRLREEINDLSNELRATDREIDRLESELEAVDPEGEIAQLEDRLESSEERIADLREEIERLEEGDRTTDSDRIEWLEEHKTELEEELAEIEERLDE